MVGVNQACLNMHEPTSLVPRLFSTAQCCCHDCYPVLAKLMAHADARLHATPWPNIDQVVLLLPPPHALRQMTWRKETHAWYKTFCGCGWQASVRHYRVPSSHNSHKGSCHSNSPLTSGMKDSIQTQGDACAQLISANSSPVKDPFKNPFTALHRQVATWKLACQSVSAEHHACSHSMPSPRHQLLPICFTRVHPSRPPYHS
jgi:hypothetical protein